MKRVVKLRLMAAAIAVVVGVTGFSLSAAATTTCTQSLGNFCGPYQYAGIPMSNGFNTYVANQDVGGNTGTTEDLMATDPGNWSVVANAVPYGNTSVQTYPDVQQLTNNWGTNGWNGASNTPLSSLSALTVNYTENGPSDANTAYEFAPDIWSNYQSDVMFWVDVQGRCNPGAYGSTILGTFTMDGQNWTANRYGGPGAEIILVDDGVGGSPDTCINQQSGSVNIAGGMNWLASHGFIPSPVTLSQVNTGWEITSADNQTFTMSSYSITATVGTAPTPTPTPSTTTSPPVCRGH